MSESNGKSKKKKSYRKVVRTEKVDLEYEKDGQTVTEEWELREIKGPDLTEIMELQKALMDGDQMKPGGAIVFATKMLASSLYDPQGKPAGEAFILDLPGETLNGLLGDAMMLSGVAPAAMQEAKNASAASPVTGTDSPSASGNETLSASSQP